MGEPGHQRTETIPWRAAGVMGMGLSGRAAAGFLARRGVRVVAVDSRPADALGADFGPLVHAGVSMKLGAVPAADTAVFAGCDVVIASPGVPPGAPPLSGARAAGIPILAEVELAARFLRGVLIGITGSNGKSTVTALVGRTLQEAGQPAHVCGNIGIPLTEVVESAMELPDPEARALCYVVELSSFQLEGIERLRPNVAVLLNLSPDHQDRYARVEEYYAAKRRLFMNQRGDDVAILNWDDPVCLQIAERLVARLFPFSLTQDLEEGAVLSDGWLVLRRDGRDEKFMKASEVPMPGSHNLENVLAAAAAAAHCGVPAGIIGRAVAGFKGLPHRLERVREVGGISYYNDSKATNVGATLRALQSFSSPIVLLLGGYDKGGDFESLRRPMRTPPVCLRALVTFGKAGDDIARRLEGAAPQIVRSASLADAVRAAAELAIPGDVVLLAPGCASFDAYSGFEKRGEDFRMIVETLGVQAGGQA
ncbi:MAG TPA: UDP-N-acetylmuramoyl-L-alanine--D-glutamate ligase [Candidatus Polarisedimenticolia bacterium]|nr:UDP-N-acetylmuramoyl-L-alanine--D-glutamate ligase [Candidatus Polarisedimenticolia bacterium]